MEVFEEKYRSALKEKIKEAIEAAQVSLDKLEDMTQPIGPENSIGRVSRMDAINNKGVGDAAKRSKQRQLMKLQKALEYIDKPQFGYCTHCGNANKIKRWIYMPESDRCVRCADR